MLFDPLEDSKSCLQLLTVWGNDKEVVEDARTSFLSDRTGELTDRDIKLLDFLIENEHTSPFRGSGMKFLVKAPLFVCRQWWKHVISSHHGEEQLGWNEQSLRYTVAKEEFYTPKVFKTQSKNNKQASGIPLEDQDPAIKAYARGVLESYHAYTDLLNLGVSREQARAVLVPAVYITWVWTASLQSVLHFVGLRRGHGAQGEIVAYANVIERVVEHAFPFTLQAFQQRNYEGF